MDQRRTVMSRPPAQKSAGLLVVHHQQPTEGQWGWTNGGPIEGFCLPAQKSAGSLFVHHRQLAEGQGWTNRADRRLPAHWWSIVGS